jgi:hypothetical protein
MNRRCRGMQQIHSLQHPILHEILLTNSTVLSVLQSSTTTISAGNTVCARTELIARSIVSAELWVGIMTETGSIRFSISSSPSRPSIWKRSFDLNPRTRCQYVGARSQRTILRSVRICCTLHEKTCIFEQHSPLFRSLLHVDRKVLTVRFP